MRYLRAALPTMISSFSPRATTEGTRFNPSSPGITTGVSPCMNATREFVVPRSIPTMRSPGMELTGLPSCRLLRLRLGRLRWLIQAHRLPRVNGSASADHALNERFKEHVGMDRRRGTHLVKTPAEFSGNGELDRAQIVFELSQLAGADD